MRWPAFNELGDLPVGVYRATLAEVIAHFGHDTAQRVTITARLSSWTKLISYFPTADPQFLRGTV
jgi:hypothetical protein